MNCEEFALTGLGTEHDTELTAAQRTAALEHSAICASCASLAQSWDEAREKLNLLADVTHVDGAPARVEMRLRQEFRTRHSAIKTRRTAVFAVWALAAAAVLVGAISLNSWRTQQNLVQHRALNVAANNISASAVNNSTTDASDSTLVAGNDENEFTPLPGTIYTGNDDAEIVRVRMPRSSLGTLGFPVNEDRAGEFIQVDLLVGNDGLPQAVRLPSENASQ
jgi:anti-sigma factor RsiW